MKLYINEELRPHQRVNLARGKYYCSFCSYPGEGRRRLVRAAEKNGVELWGCPHCHRIYRIQEGSE